MTSDSEFVAFVNQAIQLVLDLTTYPNIWAVILILLETQDINASYVHNMHDYYNQCCDTKTQEYMVLLEKAAEQSKNNMYNNTLDGVSAYVQQSVCNSPVKLSSPIPHWLWTALWVVVCCHCFCLYFCCGGSGMNYVGECCESVP